MAMESAILPYRPAWINRLNAWVERLPGPWWPYYLGFAVAIFALLTAIKWADGTYPVGTFYLPHALFACAGIYTLALVHWLVQGIPGVLERMRSVLRGGEGEYLSLLYRLSTSPAKPVALGTGLGAVWGVLLQLFFLSPVMGVLKLSVSPLAAWFDGTLLVLTWATLGGAVFCLLHLLFTINDIYLNHTRILIFQQQPLYALSGLAARSALGVAVYALLWIVLTPGVNASPVVLGTVAFMQLLAAATFIVPLLGVHGLLLREKHQLQEIVGGKLQNVLGDIHQHMEEGNASGVEGLQKMMNVLQSELGTLEKVPTWPWHPETIRLVATAILLPMLVWISQRVLSSLLPS